MKHICKIQYPMITDVSTYLCCAHEDLSAAYILLCRDSECFLSCLPRDIQYMVYPLTVEVTITKLAENKSKSVTACMQISHGIIINTYYIYSQMCTAIDTIRNGCITGPYTRYMTTFVSTNLVEKGYKINGKKHGTSVEYKNSNIAIVSDIIEYVDDLQHGVHINYDKSYTRLAHWANDKLDGIVEDYFDACIRRRASYYAGRLHGLIQNFHTGGALSHEYYSILDKKAGPHRQWDIHGNLYEDVTYVAGKRHGIGRILCDKEKILVYVTYNKGIQAARDCNCNICTKDTCEDCDDDLELC